MCTFESLLYSLTATFCLFPVCLHQKCKIFGDGMVVSHFVFIFYKSNLLFLFVCIAFPMYVRHFDPPPHLLFHRERLSMKIQFDSKLFCFQISSLMYFSLTVKGVFHGLYEAAQKEDLMLCFSYNIPIDRACDGVHIYINIQRIANS